MQQKWDQGTLGTQSSTLIGYRTHLGPSMDPAMALQYTQHGPLYIGYVFAFYATKLRSRDSGGHKGQASLGLGPTMVLQWTLPLAFNTPDMALYKFATFLYSMQQKWDQGTLGTQRSTLIGSRICLGPSMDPVMASKNTCHGNLYIGYIFAFYATRSLPATS